MCGQSPGDSRRDGPVALKIGRSVVDTQKCQDRHGHVDVGADTGLPLSPYGVVAKLIPFEHGTRRQLGGSPADGAGRAVGMTGPWCPCSISGTHPSGCAGASRKAVMRCDEKQVSEGVCTQVRKGARLLRCLLLPGKASELRVDGGSIGRREVGVEPGHGVVRRLEVDTTVLGSRAGAVIEVFRVQTGAQAPGTVGEAGNRGGFRDGEEGAFHLHGGGVGQAGVFVQQGCGVGPRDST